MRHIDVLKIIVRAIALVENDLSDDVEYYEYDEKFRQLNVLTKRGTFARVDLNRMAVMTILRGVTNE